MATAPAGELLDAQRRALEDALESVLPGEDQWPASVHTAMRYSLFAGGKRLRPLLAMSASHAVGGAPDEAIPFACAIEMIHTYSLVHDDLPAMDDDDLRRGKPTAHRVFGESIAILAGDALLTHAFASLVAMPGDWDAAKILRRTRATALLARACGTAGLIGGQVDDLAHEGRSVDAPTLERIHRAKTGALLEASVSGGAVLGGADAGQLKVLECYGRAIGLAFQIVDDVLDATGSSEKLGKTAGKDRAAGKATYVSVHGIEPARERAAELLREALESLTPLGDAAEALRELARRIVERER